MRRFLDTDYLTMCEWYARRNQTPPPKQFLPEIGLIEDGTAAGFLIRTDAKIGILEYFCSNPLTQKIDRLEALHDIAQILIITAKREGIKALICTTKFENIKRMAIKQGFDYLGEHSSYFKELI